MIKAFRGTKNMYLSRIYIPTDLYNVIKRRLTKENISFNGYSVHHQLLLGTMNPDQEMETWKNRFENDGYDGASVQMMDAIESYYSSEDIYAYAKQFFGDNIDPDYAKELKDAEEYNVALMGQQ